MPRVGIATVYSEEFRNGTVGSTCSKPLALQMRKQRLREERHLARSTQLTRGEDTPEPTYPAQPFTGLLSFVSKTSQFILRHPFSLLFLL